MKFLKVCWLCRVFFWEMDCALRARHWDMLSWTSNLLFW